MLFSHFLFEIKYESYLSSSTSYLRIQVMKLGKMTSYKDVQDMDETDGGINIVFAGDLLNFNL